MNDNIIAQMETYIEKAPFRPFDKYVLGPFLIWYGIRSKDMPKLARRIVVTAGIYQVFYSWRHYRNLPLIIRDATKEINQNV